MKKSNMFTKIALILGMLLLSVSVNVSAAGRNFYGGRQSNSFTLSNGKTIVIEYHYGEPHVHEDNRTRSENVGGGTHHEGEPGLTSSTRGIVKEGKTKNTQDKKAHDKYKEYQREIESQAEENTKNATSNFAYANKSKIQQASKAGFILTFIAGIVIFILKIISKFWWILAF